MSFIGVSCVVGMILYGMRKPKSKKNTAFSRGYTALSCGRRSKLSVRKTYRRGRMKF